MATFISASGLAAAQVKTANLPLNLAEMAVLQVCTRMIAESRASGASRRELEKLRVAKPNPNPSPDP